MHTFHSKRISRIHRVLWRTPISGFLWLAGAVAITGAPPFGLFPSELTILRAGLIAPQAWAVFVMLILLIVIFVGFLNHFRAMYFGGGTRESADPAAASRAPAHKTSLSLWCLVPMWMALIPLLLLGLWWPQALTHYFSVIAAQLASSGGTP
ncbi:MAG: hypothetical protein ABSG12_14480 [Steroidobacteraceae bacterium]